MAAPTPTNRNTPPGQALKDGYQSLIAFASNPDVLLWEKGVTPPGMDGGDAIDVTTMHTGTWRSFRSRALITLTPLTIRVAYYPLAYPQLELLLNVEQVITMHFPSGNFVAFYGFLQNFEPDEAVEGEQPEATAIITPTNWDPVNNVEEGPATGTS